MDQQPPEIRDIEAVISAGNVTLNLDKKHVSSALTNLDLTPGEFSVLSLLMRRLGTIVPYEEVTNVLLSATNRGRTHALDTAVRVLRRKFLLANADITIHTVRNRGFILIPSKS